MPTGLRRRRAAPLLVIAGAALFGLGAGGIASVDNQLEAAAQVQRRTPLNVEVDRVRGDRPRPHRGEF